MTTNNIGVIYRDEMEPQHQEVREWFCECLAADRVVAWNGDTWKIAKIEKNISFDSSPSSFVVTGFYV